MSSASSSSSSSASQGFQEDQVFVPESPPVQVPVTDLTSLFHAPPSPEYGVVPESDTEPESDFNPAPFSPVIGAPEFDVEDVPESSDDETADEDAPPRPSAPVPSDPIVRTGPFRGATESQADELAEICETPTLQPFNNLPRLTLLNIATFLAGSQDMAAYLCAFFNARDQATASQISFEATRLSIQRADQLEVKHARVVSDILMSTQIAEAAIAQPPSEPVSDTERAAMVRQYRALQSSLVSSRHVESKLHVQIDRLRGSYAHAELMRKQYFDLYYDTKHAFSTFKEISRSEVRKLRTRHRRMMDLSDRKSAKIEELEQEIERLQRSHSRGTKRKATEQQAAAQCLPRFMPKIKRDNPPDSPDGSSGLVA